MLCQSNTKIYLKKKVLQQPTFPEVATQAG